MPRSNENRSCMRVEKREFAWEFSQLSCLGQTRTRVAWELMRVEKREFAWEFSQLSCPETRTRVAWELRSESLHESFLNSDAPVKREQELHESWWKLYYRARSDNAYQFSSKFEPVQSWSWELMRDLTHAGFKFKPFSDFVHVCNVMKRAH
jgi:hypothetical protein